MWDIQQIETFKEEHPILVYAAERLATDLKEGAGLAKARVWEGHFVPNVGELWGTCREATIRPGATFVTSLKIDLFLDRHKTLTATDVVVGYGETASRSVENAVERYLDGVFSAFYAMVDPSILEGDNHQEALSVASRKTGGITQWEVFAGTPQIFAGRDSLESLEAAVHHVNPLGLVYDTIKGRLGSEDDRPHWLRVYFARQPDGEVVTECAIDNRFAPEADQQLRAFEWPSGQRLQSFRQFYVFKPQVA